VNRLLWRPDALHLGAGDRVLQKTPFSFDVSVWELFWPLMNGARLVMARPGSHRDNAYLKSLVISQGITLLHFVPSMLQLFLEEPGVEECRTVRDVICSGEALSPELARRFAARLGDVRLHNLYGPTEAAVEVTSWVCGEGDERGSIPIGRPIANTQIHLLDQGLSPLPVGVPGELFIGGVNLARGYIARPDLTAERFLPDPTGGEPGGRVYRTGDLARRRNDGAIEYLGRTDHQVKIRGVRIELGEIEAALVALEGVRETVVVAREDRPGDRRLVAYVVGDTGADVLRRSLREQLREKLPESMVPAAFVPLAALPLTPNGKVDRKALPAPEQPSAEESYVAPRTPVQEVLAGIWAAVLGVERVGASSDFFDLGGHSLLAVQVMARIEHVLGVKVPISALFEAPTVEHLAGLIEKGWVQRSAPLARLHPGGTGRPLFLVHPIGGDVFSYVELAKKLGAKRPVYALQAVAEGNGHAPSMEYVAAQYLQTMRKVQAEGPWLLGGWSSGAVMAYEMARQIESMGGTASCLAMFDPPPPPDGHIQAVSDTALLLDFSRLGRPSEEKWALIREMLEGLDVDAGLDRLLELARVEGVVPPGLGKPWLQERFNLFSHTMKTVKSYVPLPYGGRVTLFRAGASLAPGAADLTSGWGQLARTESHLLLDADHFSLLKSPALDRLVEHLESDIAAVEDEPGR
jgi:thioesterase domain-containing protein/acyl carrier protein